MAKAYSLDFRRKVVEAIELHGYKKSEVSKMFRISRNTIDLWLKRKAETGELKPKANKPPGNNHRIKDWDKFREFVKEHGDKTQAEMAELWDGPISARTICRALRKIGFSRKQNLPLSKKK
ncbi:MAG: helix-turn-helix domain-containing protein [Pseudanabaenaceae cyanobacterium]